MKKAMTKTMTQSLSIPIFMFADEFDATELMIMRKELKHQYKTLTLLPFFVKASSLAMLEYPMVNMNVNPETDSDGLIFEYTIRKDHNISIAIDSKDGLTVPIIKQVQNKSILEINEELNDLRERAEKGGLTADHFAGGTYSISSVGNIGGTYFVPTVLSP